MKILIAGDFVPCSRVAKLVAQKKFEDVFSEVRPIVERMDYSIVNFESPVKQGVLTPIKKTGPNLLCREEAMEAVKYIGFDCVTLANNHFRDHGDQGVQDTLSACTKYGIDYVGGGQNINSASKVLYKEFSDCTLAVINFCENEWSIATENRGGSAPMNFVKNYYAIQEAKKNANYVIVIVHAGIEEYNLPAPWMKDCYRYFIDCGADVVINHHQHCYSGYERYHDGLIFYGLGNFCFDCSDYRNSAWNEGYMVKLDFGKHLDFSCVPYIQCNEKATISLMTEADKIKFETEISRLNGVIADDVSLQKSYQGIVYSKEKLLDCFEPYTISRLLSKLWKKGLLPATMTNRKWMIYMNYFRDESLRDVLISLLNQKIKE